MPMRTASLPPAHRTVLTCSQPTEPVRVDRAGAITSCPTGGTALDAVSKTLHSMAYCEPRPVHCVCWCALVERRIAWGLVDVYVGVTIYGIRNTCTVWHVFERLSSNDF